MRVLVGSSSGATLHVDAFFLGGSDLQSRSWPWRKKLMIWKNHSRKQFGNISEIRPGSFQNLLQSGVWPARLNISSKSQTSITTTSSEIFSVYRQPSPQPSVVCHSLHPGVPYPLGQYHRFAMMWNGEPGVAWDHNEWPSMILEGRCS